MDDLLDLTSRVEATHFWFRGFRRFVAPAVREILRGAAPSRYTLASLVLGVVKSKPFLMREPS